MSPGFIVVIINQPSESHPFSISLLVCYISNKQDESDDKVDKYMCFKLTDRTRQLFIRINFILSSGQT